VRDVLPEIELWRGQGRRVALATVVATWGSAPRTLGSRMAVSADGSASGSVSGGCVEGAVIEAASGVLSRGQPRLLRFGVPDDTAWSVGLACGGTIEVFVEPLDDDFFLPARDALNAERPVAVAEVLSGAGLGRRGVVPADGLVSGSLDAASLEIARAALAEGRSRRAPLPDGELFVDVLLPSPRLIVVGGVHIAVALVPLARRMGFRTVVVDPRRAFGSPERFPEADEIVADWPEPALARLRVNAGTAVAVLAHDPKLDDPAVIAALGSPAFYVGALGSTRTQEKRRARLLGAGVSEEALRRLHAPIGLDLGGRSPEEIALSIMAEVVAARHGRTTPR
jgi:xanthine dehydrogenase accessory factor